MTDEKEKKRKKKNIINSFLVSSGLLFIGLSWLSEYRKYGYYTDHRDFVTIHGEQGLVTVYALLGFGLIFLTYGIYQVLCFFGSKNRKQRNMPK